MSDPVTKAVKVTERCQRHLNRFIQSGKDVVEEDLSGLTDTPAIEASLEKARSTQACIKDELQTMTMSVDELEKAIDDDENAATQDQKESFEAFDKKTLDVKELVNQMDARIARLADMNTDTLASRNAVLIHSAQSSRAASIQLDTPLFRPGSNDASPEPLPSMQFPAVPTIQHEHSPSQRQDTIASTQGRDSIARSAGRDSAAATTARRNVAVTYLNRLSGPTVLQEHAPFTRRGYFAAEEGREPVPSAFPDHLTIPTVDQDDAPFVARDEASVAAARETVAATPINQLTLADLAGLLTRIPNTQSQPDTKSFGYRIPKFSLPSFDGKPEEWKPFWDRFERAIDRNPSIADADKLSYLMSYLKGEAQMLINDMPLTNENYQVALCQLKDNFGDPRIAIEKVRQKLRDLPLISSSNFQKFREFFFVFEQLAKRLEHLGGDVNNEHLVDIILDKLPRFITDKVERAKDDDDDWTMSRLRNLLAKELRTEGKIERRMERRSILLKASPPQHDEKTDQRRNPVQRKMTTDAFVSTEQPDAPRPTHPCLFCNGNHWMNECNQFRTARERTERTKFLRLCFICLQKDHQARNCTSTRNCSHCRQTGRHHSTLCPKKFPDRFKGAEQGHYGDEAEVRDLTRPDEQGALGDDEQTVMKTAQIVAINPENESQKIRIRAYLDNGTSRTFLSERANSLNLPMGPKKTLRIKRFGNDIKPHTIEYRPALLILKSITGEKMKISVAVTSQTMSSINKVAVPVELVHSIPSSIILADTPLPVNTELQVDMMLGNDYYDDVITGKKTQLPPGFGYLIPTLDGSCPAAYVMDTVTQAS